MKNINIAIDGTVGSGKGTVARILAEKLGFKYFDTGAMYRSLGCALDNRGIYPEEVGKDSFENIELAFGDDGKAYLNGECIEEEIRTERGGTLASIYAQLPVAREFLVQLQRKMAQDGGYVMEGRDITSVVLPEAQIKFYMTASAEIRARRRTEQYEKQGKEANYEEILQQLKERDERDMTREVSPLVHVEDAILVDSSDMDVPTTVDFMLEKIEESGF